MLGSWVRAPRGSPKGSSTHRRPLKIVDFQWLFFTAALASMQNIDISGVYRGCSDFGFLFAPFYGYISLFCSDLFKTALKIVCTLFVGPK